MKYQMRYIFSELGIARNIICDGCANYCDDYIECRDCYLLPPTNYKER